jgi:RHS repeat-associated protein
LVRNQYEFDVYDSQKADLQQYADKAKKGTIVFKPFNQISLEDQQKAIDEENEDENLDGIENKALAPTITPLYFYHPDHLGTSTALTDINGVTYQFFLNLPFGETMAEQSQAGLYNTSYKFNGKELDNETGFYYYGARYYDPRISIWASVDPLAEKYPNVNPYAYCLNNPVRFIDPDGMAPFDWFVNVKTGAVVHVEGQSKLTQATADKLGAGSAKNYERLGSDNMFGDNKAANKQREFGASLVENTENFMEKQGYSKAEKVVINEYRDSQSGGFGLGENIKTGTSDLIQVGDSKVTYAKPENLNQKAILAKSVGSSKFSASESVTYKLTKPFGQENSQTAQFYQNRTSKVEQGTNAALNIIKVLIDSDFFKKTIK